MQALTVFLLFLSLPWRVQVVLLTILMGLLAWGIYA